MTATPAPHREVLVDGRQVKVFDGLIGNLHDHVAALSRAPFTRSEIARQDTSEYRHWATEANLEVLVQQPIYEQTSRVVSAMTPPGFAYRPYRAYTNVASYGDMLFTHFDSLPERYGLTALWYLCEHWDIEWGGETVFFDQEDDLAFSVMPRPGRLVIFDGAIKHAGRPPSRICFVPRYTFAIKFERLAIQR